MSSEVRAALDLRPTTGLLKALSDDNRLRMVALLHQGEQCVCHIATALDLTQPNVSQHLTVLRHVGLVDSARRGSWIYYRLLTDLDPVRSRILRAVLDGLGELAQAAEDARRLTVAQRGEPCD